MKIQNKIKEIRTVSVTSNNTFFVPESFLNEKKLWLLVGTDVYEIPVQKQVYVPVRTSEKKLKLLAISGDQGYSKEVIGLIESGKIKNMFEKTPKFLNRMEKCIVVPKNYQNKKIKYVDGSGDLKEAEVRTTKNLKYIRLEKADKIKLIEVKS